MRTLHFAGLLVGPIIGLVILQSQIGHCGWPSTCSAIAEWLAVGANVFGRFHGTQRNSQRVDDDAWHRQPIRFNRLG